MRQDNLKTRHPKGQDNQKKIRQRQDKTVQDNHKTITRQLQDDHTTITGQDSRTTRHRQDKTTTRKTIQSQD